MRSPTRALNYVFTTKPGNSESVIPLDSTRGTASISQSSLASGDAAFVPGQFRGRWAGAIVRYTVKATTQNVTALDQVMTANAGAATDWETQGAAGSHTVTAGTTAVIEFKPLGRDFRVRIDAGATGPSALTVEISVVWGEDFGS